MEQQILMSPKGLGRNCIRSTWGSMMTTTEKKDAAAAPVPAELVRSTFQRFDTDGDGRLNKQELKHAFTSLGSRLPSFRATLALHHADTNGDGYIDKQEFEALVNYVLKLGYKIIHTKTKTNRDHPTSALIDLDHHI